MLVVSVTIPAASLVSSHYSIQYYTQLQQQYTQQIVKEVSSQIDQRIASVEELYLVFSTQQNFGPALFEGDTWFQRVQKQVQFSQSVSSLINVYRLQDLITGALFYLDDETCAFVGGCPVDRAFTISQAEWYRQFTEGNGARLLYGPLEEDFKPVNGGREVSVYYIAPYGSTQSSAPGFVLFTLQLEALMDPVDAFLQDGRRIAVTDRSGAIVYAAGAGTGDEAGMAQLQQELQDQDGAAGFRSTDSFVTSYTLPALGWRVWFLDETQAVMRSLQRLNQVVTLTVVLFAVLGMAVAALLIRRITMPLAELNRMIDIMQEDPNAFLEELSNAETGKIARRLNEMKRRLQQMSREMYLVRLQETEAQISALQAQINPHFLYNTLDNIYCIAQLGETEPILCLSEQLSNMMRYSMSMKQNIVPLRRELGHMENYISILNIRFDDRIRLENRIPPPLYDAMVLKLSLQPLAENAWQHGLVFQEDRQGAITLDARVEGQVLLLYVENDGAPIPPDRCDQLNARFARVHYGAANYDSSHGIALENINNRLKLTFGADYGLRLENRAEGGCRVILRLPLRMAGPTAGEN